MIEIIIQIIKVNKIFFTTFVERISSGLEENFVFNYSSPTLSNFEGRKDLHELQRPRVMEQDFLDSRDPGPPIEYTKAHAQTNLCFSQDHGQASFVLLLLTCAVYFEPIKSTLPCYSKVSKTKKEK